MHPSIALRARLYRVVMAGVLVLAVLLGAGSSWSVAMAERLPESADLQRARLGGPPAGAEVVGMRTEHSRSYRRVDGSVQTRLSLSPQNYRDADGKWKVIDPTLRAVSAGLETTAGPLKVRLPSRANGGDVRLTHGDLWVAFGLRGAGDVPATASENRARFSRAIPEVDVDYEVGADAVKESLILASRRAPASYTFDVSASSGLTPDAAENGEVVFRDAAGNRKFTMAEPWMRDAAGEMSYDVRYDVQPREGGWTVRVVADEEWLDAADRRYPVVVDPTTYYGIAKQCEIASGSLGFQSDCTSAEMPIDVGRENGRVHRALVQFDTAELQSALGDSLVTNADLFFYWTTSTPDDVTLDLHPVSRNWSVATWYKYTSVSYWSQPGGDFSTTYDTRRTLLSSWVNGWTGLGVGRLVQGWLDGSIVNYGVAIKPQNEGLVRLDNLDGMGIVVESRPRRGAETQATFETVQPTATSKVQVNVGNGNLVYRDEDAKLPAGSNALALERTFNSLGDIALGTFGTGWTTNHGTETTLWQHWVDQSYILEGPGGLAGRFHRKPDGTYQAPPDWNASLVENGDGTVSVTFGATGERWDFDTSNPRKLTKVAKGGYEKTLTYDAAGKLTQISDTEGNELDYAYDAQTGQVTTVTNGTSQRAYTLNGSDQLMQFTAPSGSAVSYTYNGDGRIEQITYPGGTRVGLGYDATGRVTSITRKPDTNPANDRTTTFAYSAPSSPCAGYDYRKTVVTYPNAQTRTYCVDRTDEVRVASPVTSSDITDPVLTLGDEAWEDRDGWHSTGTLALTAFASDSHSGIKTVETKVDGATIDTNTQSCASGGCTMQRQPSIDLAPLATGDHTVQVTATDQANRTASRQWTLRVDKGQPALQVTGTLWTDRDDWVDQDELTVTADATDTGSGVARVEVRVDDQPVLSESQACPAGACPLSVSGTIDAGQLSSGSHTIDVIATDQAGAQQTQSWTIKVDHDNPAVALSGEVADADGQTLELGSHDLTVDVTDQHSGAAQLDVRVDGSTVDTVDQPCPAGGCSLHRVVTLDAMALPPGAHTVTAEATDAAGRQTTETVSFEVTDPGAGMDPIEAPPIDPTVPTTTANSTEFIYGGSDPVQTGMNPTILEEKRVAVIRGTVRNRAGQPQGAVKVTVLDHPEYGETVTRSDGEVYLVLNGGQQYTLVYEKEGFLPVQRQVDAPWQNWETADDVVLILADEETTQVDLSAPLDEPVVHEASPVSDADGQRQAALMLPEGAEATMRMADGTTQPLGQATLRATEYTVGESGVAAMPGELPATSGYTYAVEYTVDEAVAAGAATVEFSEPVSAYEDNFLDIPVGMAVPVGYYNRERGVWEPSADGRVLKVLSVDNDLAVLDVNGEGNPATAGELDALSIDADERAVIAARYGAGDEFWRVEISHFSGYDFNFPFGLALPGDAVDPHGEDLGGETDGQCTADGSVIGCEDQTLGESIPIEGTGLRLHFQSERQPGHKASRLLRLRVAGDGPLPASLRAIGVGVEIAGRRFGIPARRVLTVGQYDGPGWFHPPAAGQEYVMQWDGKDSFGRTVYGTQPVRFNVSYVYDTEYATARPFRLSGGTFEGGYYSFGLDPERPSRTRSAAPSRPGGGGGGGAPAEFGSPVTPPPTRGDQMITRVYDTTTGGAKVRPDDLGGWSLSNHHVYDPVGRTLTMGTGERRQVDAATLVESTLATQAALGAGFVNYGFSYGIEVGPDGTIYVSHFTTNRVVKRTPDGAISVVAGTGTAGFSGDGGSAVAAQVNGPRGLALQPDGSLLIADTNNHRIRRVAPDGTISTFAGNGQPGYAGNGGPAVDASLRSPNDVAVGADGTVYIADTDTGRIRRVDPTGGIETHFIMTSSETCGLPCRYRPHSVAVAPNNTVYAVEYDSSNPYWGQKLWRKRPDDAAPVMIANPNPPSVVPDVDGVPVQDANVSPIRVEVAPNGDVYVMEQLVGLALTGEPIGGQRLRRIDATDTISHVAGDIRCNGYFVNGVQQDTTRWAATASCIEPSSSFALGHDGEIVWMNGLRDLKVFRPALSGLGTGALVASEDGAELYEFDANGRHLRTRDPDTNAILTTFSYDSEGRLIGEQDADGNDVTVQRDGSGTATAITGPFGATTTLTMNGDQWLASATDPEANTSSFGYDADGLLTSYTDPGNKTHTYTYDSVGRLLSDESPDGEKTTLTRTETSSGHKVVLSSRLGRTREHTVSRQDGDRLLRAVTNPAGDQATTEQRPDGIAVTTQPDGTTARAQVQGDPRFSMQAPFAKTSLITLPSSRTLQQSTRRTATLTNPGLLSTVTATSEATTVNGKTASGSYTASTKRYTTTSPAGRQWKVDVDAKGRITHSEIAGSDPVDFAYDTRGRIQTVTTGSRTWTYSYATTGYLQTVQGPEGTSASYVTDDNGRVTTATLPGSRQVAFSYDQRGNLTALTPPGQGAHAFEYTDGGKVSRIVPPAISGVDADTEFAYDADGALASLTRPGGELVDFDYDTAGRPSSISSNSGDVDFAYHQSGPGKGKLSSITAPGGQALGYAYDGPLVTSLTASGPTAGTLAYDYDTDLRPASVSLNGAGAVGYGYDTDGLLTSAGPLSISRDAANGRVTNTQLSTVATSQAFDAPGRLSSMTTTVGGSSLLGFAYGYDGLDRITTKTETTGAGSTAYGYEYDPAGRLERVTKDGQTWRQYAYDANGNRTSDQQAGQLAVTSTYDAQDRLVARGGEQFTYTDAGELATRTDTATNETTTYHHTARGLTGVDLPDGTEITYTLDGLGRRVAVSHDGQVTRRYLYGLEAIGPVAELNADNTVRSRFVYATRSHVPDYMVRDGVTYRYVTDELGSVRRVVNTSDGAVEQAVDYDPYGTALSDSQPGFQPFGYAGGLTDPDTHLIRFGYRDYDPEVGRWTSKDPIGFAGGDPNVYSYVGGDLVNRVDPFGLSFLSAVGDALGQAGSFVWDHKEAIAGSVAAGACIIASAGACGLAVLGATAIASIGPVSALATGQSSVGEFARQEGTAVFESFLLALPGTRVFYGAKWASVLPNSRLGGWALNGYFSGPALLWSAGKNWCFSNALA